MDQDSTVSTRIREGEVPPEPISIRFQSKWARVEPRPPAFGCGYAALGVSWLAPLALGTVMAAAAAPGDDFFSVYPVSRIQLELTRQNVERLREDSRGYVRANLRA